MKMNCPTCKKVIEYSPKNPFRPFCSPVCKGEDLVAWAEEKYSAVVESDPDESEEIETKWDQDLTKNN